MRPVRVTVGTDEPSNYIPVDHYCCPVNIGLGVALTAGAALTYSVEHTFDDIWAVGFSADTATWHTHEYLATLTATADGNYAFPVTAIRLNVTAYTGGSATLTVIQAGVGR